MEFGQTQSADHRTAASFLAPLAPRAHRPAAEGSDNVLLREFGQAVQVRLLRSSTLVTFSKDAVLAKGGAPMETILFPESGMLALCTSSDKGPGLDGLLVGREGAVGLAEGMSDAPAPWSCHALSAGAAWAAPAELVAELLRWDPAAANAAWRYMARLGAQQHRALACGALHSGYARLARLLLEWSEHTGSERLTLTQERLSMILGLRRTTVTLLMGQLVEADVIDTGRGRIVLRDRQALEERSCSCRTAQVSAPASSRARP